MGKGCRGWRREICDLRESGEGDRPGVKLVQLRRAPREREHERVMRLETAIEESSQRGWPIIRPFALERVVDAIQYQHRPARFHAQRADAASRPLKAAT